MGKTMQVEVWVIVSENEDYHVGCDEETAAANYETECCQLCDAGSTRRIKVTLTVPVPEAVCLEGVVPDEATEGCTLAVK